MRNKTQARDLGNNCTVVLPHGTFKVKDIEWDEDNPINVLIQYEGGTFKCVADTEFVHIRPMVFRMCVK